MNQPSTTPAFQMWVAMKDVEEYIRTDIVRQMNGAESFGGEDMLPLRRADQLCERLKPVISTSMYRSCRHAIQVAADGLNAMLGAMRQASMSPPDVRNDRMVFACDSSRRTTLEKYQLALAEVEPLVGPESVMAASVTNNITISHNSGVINLQSVLRDVTQSISQAESLDARVKQTLTTLFDDFTKHLAAAQADEPEAAEAAAEQAKELAAELARPRPRAAVLRIKGSGLIEAAKALARIVPMALATAQRIVEFVGTSC